MEIHNKEVTKEELVELVDSFEVKELEERLEFVECGWGVGGGMYGCSGTF